MYSRPFGTSAMLASKTRLLTAVLVAIVLLGASMGLLSLAFSASPAGTSIAASAAVVAGSSPAGPSTPVAPHAPSYQPVAPGPSAEARLQAQIQAQHVDLRKIYPPNLEYAPTLRNGMVVAPSYPQAPEPAGLADYGVMNSTGTPTPFTIDTTSYRATVGLASVAPYYLANGVPEGFTSQLNVVLANVTVHGHSDYTFWTQNVFFYDAYSSQLFIENNIWNFSSAPPSPQPVNTFFYLPGYTNGSDNPSIGYYAAGTPTFNGISTPFSIVFYINATTLLYQGSAYTEVNFAFDLLNGAGGQVMSDQYDRALFNNTGGSATIPQAHFHVDGTTLTPTGFIPYDAEVMLGGPGGGSTATFNAINATMTLQHWNATARQYVNEPSAWSSGSETGETAVGVAEYYTAGQVAHLNGGPEFIQPFWNSSATPLVGPSHLRATIAPSNSWAFVTDRSTYNSSEAAWAPIPVSGAADWQLTNGAYSVKVMESDYTAVIAAGLAITPSTGAALTVSLVANASAGVYTPLYAYSNSQLPAISSGGTGAIGNPYRLVNNEYGPLAPEFATFNDYAFPSYAGISLVNTSAYVLIANPAPFSVDYWGPYAVFAQQYSVPTTNELSIWAFQTSHVSVLGGTISGWFSANQAGFPFANVVLWNATSSLVAGVTFDVVSNALFTYGGTGNTVTANTFQNSVLPGNFMPGIIAPYGTVPPGQPLGVSENEGGDLFFNNYFAATQPAFQTNYNVFDDLYATVPITYSNNWNLTSPIAAGSSVTINGIPVPTQSVTGSATLCGNFWWNYQPGLPLPFNSLGFILNGGDACPAGPTLFPLPVVESGLASGSSWSATVVPAPSETLPFGGTVTGAGSLSFELPAGQYTIEFGSVSEYTAIPTVDFFTIEPITGKIVNASGPISAEAVTYAPMTGLAIFAAAGLPTGTSWSVTVASTTLSGTSAAHSTSLAFGTYAYTVATVSGYLALPASGTVSVPAGGTVTVDIGFRAATTAGTLTGTVTPNSASVTINAVAVSVTNGTFSVAVSPGTVAVEASAAGYYTYYNNVTVTSGGTTTVGIALNPVTPPTGPNGQIILLVSTSGSTATIDGTAVTLAGGTFTGSFAPGVHAVVVSAPGYSTYYNNVTVTSGQATTVNVALNPTVGSSSSNGGTISNTAWAIIGVLAVVAVILFITTLIFARRVRPVMMHPEETPPRP